MIDTDYIKERRRQEKLRLKDMAERLNYSSANGYWRLERGLTRPRLDHLVKLSETLGEPLENFIKK